MFFYYLKKKEIIEQNSTGYKSDFSKNNSTIHFEVNKKQIGLNYYSVINIAKFWVLQPEMAVTLYLYVWWN